jgi:hypothetical protein
MHCRLLKALSFVGLIGLICGPATGLRADEGQPVAIRFWPEHAVTVETMWNLHVGLRNGSAQSYLPRVPDLELQLEKQPVDVQEYPAIMHAWSGTAGQEYVLDRKPNEEKPAWKSIEEFETRSGNAIVVSRIPLELAGANGKPAFVSMISVDGVRIVDTGGATAKEFLAAMTASPEQARVLHASDALIISAPGPDAETLLAITGLLKPRLVVIPAGTGVEKVGETEIRVTAHNTLALSASKEGLSKTLFVALTDAPHEMNGEMADLYAAKEAACKRSCEIFSPLSVDQMNFLPGDGSHTPRWNAEHMMGRELGFFSRIYNNIDPAIPVMDLNPKQMPDEYRFAHPDWSGAEEARQMERVQAFNRRFAYLLDGIGVDDRIKGNPFGSLRRLLVQMDRHYAEHTGNVEKKMKLPHWPAN